jgi:hypothetical protein
MPRHLKSLLLRTLGGVALFFGLCFVLGVAAGFLMAHDDSGSADTLMIGFAVVIAIVAMVCGMVGSIVWMRGIDEAAREAHKAAWFWGGSGGMMVAGVGVILAVLPQTESWRLAPLWFGRDDPVAWLAAGCVGSLLLMIVGYALVWAWWWLARR